MTDTSPDVERRWRERLLGRPGEARLRMGSSMCATALGRGSIPTRDPSTSPPALRQAPFLRFYGGELDAAACERIIARLGDA